MNKYREREDMPMMSSHSEAILCAWFEADKKRADLCGVCTIVRQNNRLGQHRKSEQPPIVACTIKAAIHRSICSRKEIKLKCRCLFDFLRKFCSDLAFHFIFDNKMLFGSMATVTMCRIIHGFVLTVRRDEYMNKLENIIYGISMQLDWSNSKINTKSP